MDVKCSSQQLEEGEGELLIDRLNDNESRKDDPKSREDR